MTHISSERIASIEARRHELAEAMARADVSPEEFVRLSKDYAAIEPVATAAREVRRLRAELAVLNDTLEGAFRHRYPGFRPANDDRRAATAAAA